MIESLKQLKEIEDRLEQVTPGPWYWAQMKGFGPNCFLWSKTDRVYNIRSHYIAQDMSGFANCDFIAASREDVPALCATIRKLLEALDVAHGHRCDSKRSDVVPEVCDICSVLDALPKGLFEEEPDVDESEA